MDSWKGSVDVWNTWHWNASVDNLLVLIGYVRYIYKQDSQPQILSNAVTGDEVNQSEFELRTYMGRH